MTCRDELEVARETPSARAPDGSPVELYKLLPTLGEPELIHASIPEGAAVLELGCGTGRITHALLALGHPVTAVDDSPDMMAEVRGAERILSRIEDLHLARTFPCVLLMSNLVNAADERRRAFLRCCREHVAPNGIVIIERLDPDSLSGSFTGDHGPFHIEVEQEREGDAIHGVVVYSLPDGRHWTHRFDPGGRILDDEAIRAEVSAAGLGLVRVFGPKRRWCAATPA